MRWMVVLMLAGCGSEVAMHRASPPSSIPEYVADEVLVGVGIGLSPADRQALWAIVGGAEAEFDAPLGVARVLLPEGSSVLEAVQQLAGRPGVRFAEPDYIVRALAAPNDPYYAHQWNLQQIHVEQAWTHTKGKGVTVAILDTGVWTSGDDGISNLLDGWNFVDGNDGTGDYYGHGTHVAGTVAQRTNNGKGAAGIAPEATILPVKVLGDNGWGTAWSTGQGMRYAADQGADVVNMSLGSWGSSQYELDAVNYARSKGVVLVAAAGNEDTGQLNYPARYDGVISVSATNFNRKITGYSNWGAGLDLAAPGGESWQDADGDGWYDGIYQEVWGGSGWTVSGWQGTSMATPHVAGAAALVRAAGIEDPDEVEAILEETARNPRSDGYDEYYGHGIIHVGAAVALAVERAGGEVEEPEEPEEPIEEEEPEEPEEPIEEEEPEALLISDVQVGAGPEEFWVRWNTNRPTTGSVIFEYYGEYTDDDKPIDTSHFREFWGCSGCTFELTVKGVDASGEVATSGPFSVTSE